MMDAFQRAQAGGNRVYAQCYAGEITDVGVAP